MNGQKTKEAAPKSAADEAHGLYYSMKTAEALDLLRKRVKEEPKDAEAWMCLGDILLGEEAYGESVEAYRAARECGGADKDNVLKASMQVIQVLRDNIKDYAECRKEVMGFISFVEKEFPSEEERKPFLVLAYHAAGVCSKKLGDYADAQKQLRKAIELAMPADKRIEDERAYYQLGEAYLRDAKWREAEDCFSKVIMINSNLDDAWMSRGLARGFGGDLQGGLDDVKTAIAKNEKNAIARNEKTALAKNEKYHRAWCAKGILEIRALKYEDAVESLTKALSLQPDYDVAREWLRVALRRDSLEFLANFPESAD